MFRPSTYFFEQGKRKPNTHIHIHTQKFVDKQATLFCMVLFLHIKHCVFFQSNLSCKVLLPSNFFFFFYLGNGKTFSKSTFLNKTKTLNWLQHKYDYFTHLHKNKLIEKENLNQSHLLKCMKCSHYISVFLFFYSISAEV